MRKTLYILVLFLFTYAYAHAETILLRTGARVSGTIVFQNEEVIILRDAEGARFQYPRSEVEEILADEESDRSEESAASEQTDVAAGSDKKASILLEAGGGVAILPNESAGGAFSADLLVGSHRVAGRYLFIGGGLGYRVLFAGKEKYHILPVQVALRMPFMDARHAPVFGASIGYGIALSKDYLGGLYAGIDFGYRCQINPKTAVSVVGFAQFQQTTIQTTELIEGNEYTNRTGRNFFTPGIKMALYF